MTNVLFLSKRGLSRAPLAREVMRKLLHLSDHFGSIRPLQEGFQMHMNFVHLTSGWCTVLESSDMN